jgi:hypothetical protein
MSLSLFAQEDTPWGKYVFKEVNVGYDEVTRMLITPKDGLSREGCDEKNNPDRFTCTEEQGLVTIFIDEHSPGNFETTVLHPAEKGRNIFVSISTFVEEGKVVQQLRCFYRA